MEEREKKRKNYPGAGRPAVAISQETFEGLCAIQCTEEEICSVLRVSKSTLLRWCKKVYKQNFADIYAEKRAAGRVSLRRTQWKMAEKSVPMAIFLGKQYLGQKDKPETDTDADTLQKLDEILSGVQSAI